MLHTVLSFFVIFLVIYGIECHGYGVTQLQGPVQVNQNFTISCYVEKEDGRLDFYEEGGRLVSEEYIKRHNQTHIEMTRSYAKPVKKNFTCKQKNDAIAPSEVEVDDFVQKVQSFGCRTTDLVELKCLIVKPPSIAPINYVLKYSTNRSKQFFRIPLKPNNYGGFESKLNLSELSRDLGNLVLSFRVKSSNFLNYETEKFEINLLEALTPLKLENVKTADKLITHNSAIVSFSLPKDLEQVSDKLMFRVELADDVTEEFVKVENPQLEIGRGQSLLALNNRLYANTGYRVRIRFKARIASDTEEMWSPFVEVAFKTHPKVPDVLPSTCRNCFNVMDNGNVVAYWTAVSKQNQSGEDFEYLVRGLDADGNELFSDYRRNTSMVLTSDIYAIELLSKNKVGISEKFTQLIVSNAHKRKLLKIHKELKSGNYEISWKMRQSLEISGFTVISCNQRNDLPNQCDGPISFHNVSKDTFSFSTEATVTKHFGIAANSRDKNVRWGFEWAECTAANEDEIGRVHSFWSSSSTNRSITVEWKLNCIDEPITLGYNITFCPVSNESAPDCSGPMLFEFVAPDHASELFYHEIHNLRSYQFYRISIALMSVKRHGMFKDPIFARTKESAPTAARNLRVVKINQESVELEWDRPSEVNGELMTYQLWWNERKIDINNNRTLNETFSYELRYLQAFTNYTITVVACTSECSAPSDSIILRTRVGKPSPMLQLRRETIQENEMRINWEPPRVRGGQINFYQLKVASPKFDRARVYRVDSAAGSCVLQGLKCDMDNIAFFIRAVNVEGSEVPSSLVNRTSECFSVTEAQEGCLEGQFCGEWSPSMNFVCQMNISLSMVGTIFLTTLTLVVFVYMFIRLYQKYKDMKDIHIIWPKGLDPDSPMSSPSKSSGIKDLDLVRDHCLTDIAEEDEKSEKVVQPTVDVQEKRNSDVLIPFLVNPKTNEVTYITGKMKKGLKVKSLPCSPEHAADGYSSVAMSSNDLPPGYMKMYAPQRSTSETTMQPVQGYLDMSGSSPTKPNPPAKPIPPQKASDYVDNEIKMFLADSTLHRNGYIGKRASLLIDPSKKHSTVVNANGYIGLKRN